MKILLIASDNYSGSGAFLCLVDLCRLMENKYGHQVKVLLPYKGDGNKMLREYDISYKMVKSFNWIIGIEERTKIRCKVESTIKKIVNVVAIMRIATLAKKEKYDVIHINTTYSYVGAIAAKLIKCPFIWHIREFVDEQGQQIWNREKGYKEQCKNNLSIYRNF